MAYSLANGFDPLKYTQQHIMMVDDSRGLNAFGALVAHQVRRIDNCITRGPLGLAFVFFSVTPVLSIGLALFPAILNTLKKSNCRRSLARSLIFNVLNMEASTFHRNVLRTG